ncbi:MAG: hypothetical protein AAGL66_06095, partial [Pseudomonadota bacterium]
SPVIQTQLANTAGASATLAFAVNGSMLYFGQGLGASLGGAVFAASSIVWVGAAGACVAVLGFAVASGLKDTSDLPRPVPVHRRPRTAEGELGALAAD